MESVHKWFRQTAEKVEITGFAAEGKAIGRVDDIVVFVDRGAPGDVVDILIKKTKRNFFEGEIVNIHKPSPHRVEPVCKHFGLCGGCRWQHLSYAEQLAHKQQQVIDSLLRIGKVQPDTYELLSIAGAGDPYYYRNKLEFTFTNRKWITREDFQASVEDIPREGLGFHVPNMFDKVFDVEKCWLQPEPSNAIRNAVREFAKQNALSFWDFKKEAGLLRNLIIRNSSRGDVMVIVVFGHYDTQMGGLLLEYIVKQFPEINTLAYFVNSKKNSSLNDLEPVIYKGSAFMEEQMDGLKFSVGPKSFYQTNSAQAKVLYGIARNFASLKGNEVVYDLYTGTGTIALFVAPQATKVVGIDYVEEAIAHARENALKNNIENAQFFAGDMAKVFTPEFIQKNGFPDVVITDPPRAGMHPVVVKSLLECAPQKIVYVSCNPATQARDIEMLSTSYAVNKVQAVDMFPQTHHVESVALLTKR